MTKSSRKIQRRQESLCNYIDAIVQTKSRIDVVRVDLSYKKDYRDQITLEKFDSDINRLYSNQRSNSLYSNIVGYINKLEQGENNHLHAHVIFFIDGQRSKAQTATKIANGIGDYWDKVITKGKGCHYNCNMGQYRKDGLGRIEYSDTIKIQTLKENVLPYFCKDEQSVFTSSDKNIKALRRGVMPKQTNMGRPRKYDKTNDND